MTEAPKFRRKKAPNISGEVQKRPFLEVVDENTFRPIVGKPTDEVADNRVLNPVKRPEIKNLPPKPSEDITTGYEVTPVSTPESTPMPAPEAGKTFSRRSFLKAAFALEAAVALGGVGTLGYFLTKEKGKKSNPVVSPKPTENNTTQEATEPPQTPTPVSTPEPTPTPKDYVQEAIKTGLIELKEAGDWEKYFTAITVEEASKMIEEVNSAATKREEYRVLLPFDPRNSPNLIIEQFKNPSTGSIKLGLDNIAPDTVLYASLSGIVETATAAGPGGKINTYLVQDAAGNFAGIGFHAESITTYAKLTGSKKTGERLTQIGHDLFTAPFYANTNNYQGLLTLGFQEKVATSITIKNILQKNGKIVFIAQQQK